MNTCINCRNNIARFDAKLRIQNGIICASCENKLLHSLDYHIPPTITEKFKLKSMPLSIVREKLDNFVETVFDSEAEYQGEDAIPDPIRFSADRAIKAGGIEADFTAHKLMIRASVLNKKRLMPFTDIASYRPYVRGRNYNEVSKVGVTVYFTDGQSMQLSLISSKTKANSWVAHDAQKRIDELSVLLDRIIEANHDQQPILDTVQATPINSASAADEIKKFKDLLDAGVITQDEFDKKKTQLLDL